MMPRGALGWRSPWAEPSTVRLRGAREAGVTSWTSPPAHKHCHYAHLVSIVAEDFLAGRLERGADRTNVNVTPALVNRGGVQLAAVANCLPFYFRPAVCVDSLPFHRPQCRAASDDPGAMAKECLILGCSQAGKTLLLRRLTSAPGKSVNLETVPTVRRTGSWRVHIPF